MKDNYFLIGDVGGTNSQLAIVKNGKVILKRKFKTNLFETLNDMVQDFLFKNKYEIKKVIFGIAGDVKKKNLILSNSNLRINKKEIKEKNNFKEILFLNDFEALAYFIFNYKRTEIKILRKRKNKISKKKLVIGPGTGLGIAFVENEHVIHTEKGHNKFKGRDLEYEDLLSGRGITNMYKYYGGGDKTAEEIFSLRKKDKIASKTFNMFFDILAYVIKDLVKQYDFDEVYIYSGIIQKNLNFNKVRFLDLIGSKDLGIYIIKNYEASLIGLKNYIDLI